MVPLNVMWMFIVMTSATSVIANLQKSYTGYQVLNLEATTKEQFQALSFLKRTTPENEIEFWTDVTERNSIATAAVAPNRVEEVERFAREHGITLSTMSSDLQRNIDEELAVQLDRKTLEASNKFDLFRYHSYDEILEHLENIANNCGICELFRLGESHESREMVGIKISKSGHETETKRSIWIDGGIHAREWISPATVLYLIQQLVDPYLPYEQREFAYAQPTSIMKERLIEMYDWYILPVMNPDGYEYSRNSDRMWRKNREPNPEDVHCVGTDLNRNWGVAWGDGGGRLEDVCSQIYAGTEKFSAIETKNVMLFLTGVVENPFIYLTMHSYGQLILTPWGYTPTHAPNYNQSMVLADVARNAIYQTHRETYTAGTAPDLLYTAAGCSDDWAMGELGVEYSYTFELRGNHYTGTGFVLPPEEIQPTGEEIWAAVEAMALYVH